MDREARIKDLISKMTLEEKVSQLSYTSPAIERLGIPQYNWWNEALHGIARAGLATVFPQAIALAASFDEVFIRQVASAISDEARAKYNEAVKRGNRNQYYGLTFWTPNINIFRDPRWGRGQETYGEDPFLTGRIGLAFMQGLQGDDPERLKTAACAKHFAVHSGPEKLRHVFDAQVSQKDLFETYLPAFKLLAENGVEAFMGAYNRTLGEPCCGSTYLLKDILRGAWGFKGHVTSDCWAIRDFHENHKVTRSPEESAALALNAGCDLNCGCTYPMLTLACKQGLVTRAAIDAALSRLLRTRFKLGMFDPPEQDPYAKLGRETIGSEKHRQLAREAAQKSIVLLKNEGNLLPLDDSAKTITLVGPAAANIQSLLGNYYGLNSRLVTILEGLAAKVGEKPAISFEYRQGSLMYDDIHQSFQAFGATGHDDAPMFGLDNTDVVIACYGLDGAMEGEEGDAIASDSNGDRDAIELPPWQLKFLRRIRKAGKKLILVLTGGSPIAFPEDIADAILFAWYPGEEGGNALADIIFGDAIPSGRLPITFPASTAQLPPYEDYAMRGRTYRYMEEKPLYPFGFGLSYTSFRFDSLSLSADTIAAGGSVKASLSLSNTGSRDAVEVVQIYAARENRRATDPITSLRAFRRVAVPAGKTLRVEFELAAAAFESVNEAGISVLEPGAYTLTAAGAAPIPVALERGAARPVSAIIKVL
ncbi:MAG: glycoside hydrolase family 3 C-terminal domain-containing protein [Treponema sp.]|jgi:beta-glucosidase|nr:glycoside hydrolase family 3 C-terminal domain-containing protein [Treponema sp.]